MKYAIIIPDGCADEPQEALGGKTPLEAANVPNMDAIAKAGIVGRANHVPSSLPPGSDVANLSVFGYNPLQYYTGRAPLEAAAQGIELGPKDWAIRCNLVTIENQVMVDFTAGHISTEEAQQLMQALQEELGNEQLEFRAGVSYRNLVIYRASGKDAPFSSHTRTTPPHDITDKNVADEYPRGPGSDLLVHLMNESVRIFADHPVNRARKAAGKRPATNIWLWGLGKRPQLPPFKERFGLSAAVITAVDLLRGLAALIGWERIDVPGATGYLDTDYAAKGRHAVEALNRVDLICVHIEAPDEASHQGDLEAKVKSIEQVDRHIVGPLYEALRNWGGFRILVLPDHPTPLRLKTHCHGYVPWVMAGTAVAAEGFDKFDEHTAAQSKYCFDNGWQLMEFFLGGR